MTYRIVCPAYQSLLADDTAVVVNANSLQNLEFFLNSELPKINIWMNKKLTINPPKSYALVIPPTLAVKASFFNIRLNSSEIEVNDCINYLSLLIYSKLFFDEHINMIVFKLFEAFRIMNKLKYLSSSSILRRLCYDFFHPHLLYRIIIRNATYKFYLKPFEILQNKALCIIDSCLYNHISVSSLP